MQIGINANGHIRIAEIYNPIQLVAGSTTLTICERDGGFELNWELPCDNCELESGCVAQPGTSECEKYRKDNLTTA